MQLAQTPSAGRYSFSELTSPQAGGLNAIVTSSVLTPQSSAPGYSSPECATTRHSTHCHAAMTRVLPRVRRISFCESRDEAGDSNGLGTGLVLPLAGGRGSEHRARMIRVPG